MKILIADDDASIRRLIRRVLMAELEVEIKEANDGLGALEALKEGEFDLVILDINMGLLDGAETLAAMRNVDALRHLPVIMISGAADESKVKQLIGLGVKGLVAKPLSLAVLRERMLPLITQVVPPRRPAVAALASRSRLNRSSRIQVVGPGRAYWELLESQLGHVCNVVHHPSATVALRQAITRPPDIVFVTSGDPLMPANLFAKALRRESAVPPRLILCDPSPAADDVDSSLFDARLSGDVTPQSLIATLRSQLTDAGMSVLLLQPQSPIMQAFVESVRATVEGTLGEAVLASREAPREESAPERGIDVSIHMSVDGRTWRLAVVLAHALAIRHASHFANRNTDYVSQTDVMDSARALTRDFASTLRSSLIAHDVTLQPGSPVARPVRQWESGVGPDQMNTVPWWLVARRRNAAVAAVNLVPIA